VVKRNPFVGDGSLLFSEDVKIDGENNKGNKMQGLQGENHKKNTLGLIFFGRGKKHGRDNKINFDYLFLAPILLSRQGTVFGSSNPEARPWRSGAHHHRYEWSRADNCSATGAESHFPLF